MCSYIDLSQTKFPHFIAKFYKKEEVVIEDIF